MSQQYYPIIFQFGARFIRAGFAGDAAPIVRRRTNSYDLTGLKFDTIDTTHALDTPTEEQTEDDGEFLWTYDLTAFDEDTLESTLERIIHDIYRTDLLVDPKKCKVLIVEPPFFPLPLKRNITKVLLFHIHAQSVRFFPEPVMSCVSSGSHCGLVIDLGWNQSSVTPVFDLRQLYKHAKVTLRGGRWLHDEVRQQMSIEGCLIDDFEFIESFICEAMYLVDGDDEDSYEFGDVQIPNKLRHLPLEATFFSDGPEDDNTRAISDLAAEALQEMNIDLRGALKDKVIITGGLSHIPGLKTRLLQEIQSKVSDVEGIQSLGAWEGASLYCSTALMPSSSSQDKKRWPELVRDKYLAGEATVMDWTDNLYSNF